MSLRPSTRLGPYEILAAIGAGGMGEVYRAHDTKLGRDVAIKVLPDAFAHDEERLARFKREAQVLASLNHPNIAAIYGLEESSDIHALVMELVEGPTLVDRIAPGPMPLAEALRIARQIAEAMEAAHEKGIVHRDLKPANVKLTPEGEVKVLDFGLAKALEGDTGSFDRANSPTITLASSRAGVILGTAAYMSPEQAKGKPVDRRADIWAFGVVLFEMLAGRQTYSGDTAAEMLASVMKDEPAWNTLPAGTPASIRKLLRRCLEKDPKRRLQAIGEARIAIEETLAGATAEQPVSERSALLWPVVAAVAVVAALAAGTVAVMHLRETTPPERVLRYSIDPPEKTTVHTFALSPDGRYLAIAAANPDGKRQLWVRPVDSLQAQAYPGTEDAQYPFWSPDSRYIGFFAQGKLRKISVGVSSGHGPAQTLCDAADGRSGAWNRDGMIVFAPAPFGGLQRVPAAGGAPAEVTKTAASHRFPIFLPDGRHFLYLSNAEMGDAQKDGIYLGSLDSKENRRLLPDLSSVVYAPPAVGNGNGHLLFVRESTLMAQPFDPKSLQMAGELFPVAEHIAFGANSNNQLVSASDDGLLVFQSGRMGAPTQLAWFDRSGKQVGSVAALGTGNGLALSPDEKIVAIPRLSDPQKLNLDIWLHEFSRATDTRFTFSPSRNTVPVWSPDGTRIVFSSNRSGRSGLYLKDVSGTRPEELLAQSPYPRSATDWSRDGRWLVFMELDPKTKSDLWILQVDTAGVAAGAQKPVPFLQTEFNETLGRFSPDGHWMAYTSDESGRYEVYVRPFPSGAGKWKISTAGGAQPRWRRDGNELFYVSPDRKLTAVGVKAVLGAKPAFEPGTPEPLFEMRLRAFSPALPRSEYVVAGDGKRFLIQIAEGETAAAPIMVVQNWLAGVKR